MWDVGGHLGGAWARKAEAEMAQGSQRKALLAGSQGRGGQVLTPPGPAENKNSAAPHASPWGHGEASWALGPKAPGSQGAEEVSSPSRPRAAMRPGSPPPVGLWGGLLGPPGLRLQALKEPRTRGLVASQPGGGAGGAQLTHRQVVLSAASGLRPTGETLLRHQSLDW